MRMNDFEEETFESSDDVYKDYGEGYFKKKKELTDDGSELAYLKAFDDNLDDSDEDVPRDEVTGRRGFNILHRLNGKVVSSDDLEELFNEE